MIRITLNGGPLDGDTISIDEATYERDVVQVPAPQQRAAEFRVGDPITDAQLLTYHATRWKNRYGREWKTWEWREEI